MFIFTEFGQITVWARHKAEKNNANPLRLTKNSRTTNRIWCKSFFANQLVDFKGSIFYFFM